METDRSEGWEEVAERFVAVRSGVGASLVRAWARQTLPPAAAILDIGCGSGAPIAQALVEEGFTVSGIDASPTLAEAFRRRFPEAESACEAAQDSAFFSRRFDGVVAIGLLFLLTPEDQEHVLRRVADALVPGGRLLFSAPRQRCDWRDMLTGRPSLSLGEQEYARILQAAGLRLIGCRADEGGNNYFDAAKPSGT